MARWSRSWWRPPTPATGSATTRSSRPRWCLLEAGHEATVNTLGNGTRALLQNPDQWRRMVGGEVDAATATEELLRYDSPLQFFNRWVLEPGVEIAGRPMAVGDDVVMLFGSAQRDPRRFESPDRLDVGRGDPTHIGFGGGTHFCVGAPLARAELSVAFADLVRLLPQHGAGRRTDPPPGVRHPRPHRTPPQRQLAGGEHPRRGRCRRCHRRPRIRGTCTSRRRTSGRPSGSRTCACASSRRRSGRGCRSPPRSPLVSGGHDLLAEGLAADVDERGGGGAR